MPHLKLISVAIDDSGASVDIGPGTHGADCADIIEGFGQSIGTIVRDTWRPEENCPGNCGKCETNYYDRQKELRAKQ